MITYAGCLKHPSQVKLTPGTLKSEHGNWGDQIVTQTNDNKKTTRRKHK